MYVYFVECPRSERNTPSVDSVARRKSDTNAISFYRHTGRILKATRRHRFRHRGLPVCPEN
jgi:hypothetical protein